MAFFDLLLDQLRLRRRFVRGFMTKIRKHQLMDLHRFALTAIISIPLTLIVTGCSSKPTEPILVDSFFSGWALLDINDNGQIDSDDTPVSNATFIVALQGGGEFGDQTDDTGRAFVTIPARVEYPVTVRMEAPKDSALKLITPSSVTVSAPTGTVQFLFSK